MQQSYVSKILETAYRVAVTPINSKEFKLSNVKSDHMQHASWSSTFVNVPICIPAEKFKQLLLHLAEVIKLCEPTPHPTVPITTSRSNWGGLCTLCILKGHIFDISIWLSVQAHLQDLLGVTYNN